MYVFYSQFYGDSKKQSVTKVKNIQPLIEQPALPPPYAGPPQPTIQYTAYEPPAIPPQYVAKPQFIPSSIALPVTNIHIQYFFY